MGEGMKAIWFTFLAVALLVGLGLGPAAAETPTPPAGQPAKTVAGKVVLDDIERTLGELSDHLAVGPKRVRVGAPERLLPGGEVPASIDLSVGKATQVDLPGDAREVIVGDPAIAEVAISSKRRLFVLGRKAGRSNVFVMNGAGNLIARVEVVVGVDLDAVRQALKRGVPNETIDVRNEAGTLMLTGSVNTDGAAGKVAAIARRFVDKDENLVNLIRVSREQQVLIQVRVAEVQRNALKEIGFGNTISSTTPVFGALNLTGSTFSRGLTRAAAPAASLTFTGISDLITSLTLLEERGLVRSLAEPNLVAVSGEIASMLAGGEYPVPVTDNDGIKIEYKPFGVTLSFLPVVLESGRISLKLTTEVSSLSSAAIDLGQVSVNSFTVRRATSTVELPSGGSLMLAGLIQNDILQAMNGVPGLMDMPILGQLFRSDSFKRNETELVVVVNASLVRPTAPAALVSPTDTLSPGGDLDRWLFGQLTGRYAPGFVNDAPERSRNMPMFGFTLDEVQP